MAKPFQTLSIVPGVQECQFPNELFPLKPFFYGISQEVSGQFITNLFWNIKRFRVSGGGSVGIVCDSSFPYYCEQNINYTDIEVIPTPPEESKGVFDIAFNGQRQTCSTACFEGTGGPFCHPGLQLQTQIQAEGDTLTTTDTPCVYEPIKLQSGAILKVAGSASNFSNVFFVNGSYYMDVVFYGNSGISSGLPGYYNAINSISGASPYGEPLVGFLTIKTDEGEYKTGLTGDPLNLCDPEGPDASVNFLFEASRKFGDYETYQD